MNEDEGHEDKLIHRIIDEAVKNIFGLHFDVREFRPIVDFFESGQNVEIGDMLPTKAVLERIAKVPGLRKYARRLASHSCPTSKIATPATRPRPARQSSSLKACMCIISSTRQPRRVIRRTGGD